MAWPRVLAVRIHRWWSGGRRTRARKDAFHRQSTRCVDSQWSGLKGEEESSDSHIMAPWRGGVGEGRDQSRGYDFYLDLKGPMGHSSLWTC